MEYQDFLEHFEFVERTQLFDSSWVQSSHWLNVRSRPMGSAWQFGDVSCESSASFLSNEHHDLRVCSHIQCSRADRDYPCFVPVGHSFFQQCRQCGEMVIRFQIVQ